MLYRALAFITLLCFVLSLQSNGQATADTLFYEIESEMIKEAKMYESDDKKEYRILVRLKKEYHSDYKQETKENIGNFFAVVYEGEVISPSYPSIQVGIEKGDVPIGPFEEQAKAQAVLEMLK